MKLYKSITNHNKYLWVYFLLTFTLSWIMWIPLAASGIEINLSGGKVSTLALLMFGAFSPSIIGVLMTYRTTDKAGRRDFWRRLIDFRLIKPGWYATILLIFPVIMGLTFLIESMLGYDVPPLKSAFQTLSQPSALLVFFITMLIGGPLAEELGWRGFALDQMQKIWDPMQSSLLLGGLHAAWHLPLFFMTGTSQGSMRIGTILFWLWVVQVVAGAIIFTWAFNYNHRSILSAVLIHFMSNATFTIIAQLGKTFPIRTEIIRTALTIVFAVIMVIISRSKKMTL